jgi:hypothetical protein
MEYEGLVAEFSNEFLRQKDHEKLPDCYEVSLETIEFWMNCTQENFNVTINQKFNNYFQELNKILLAK